MRCRGFLVVGALLALAVAGSGCRFQVSIPPGGTTTVVSSLKESETVPAQRFEVRETPRIVVDNRVGKIAVVAGDDGVVLVEAVKRAGTKEDLASIALDAKQDKGTVTVRWATNDQNIVNRALDITIQAPKAAALELETGNGAVAVEGFAQGAHAKTGVGTITVKQVAGDLTLNTGNGAIDVEGANGAVKAETGVGTITLKGTTGARTAHTGNGAVVVDGAEGAVQVETSVGTIDAKRTKGSLALHTGNGAVHVTESDGPVVVETMVGTVNVAGRLSGASRLHTGNGAVTVTLPADSRLEIKADTGNGRITNAFGLPVEGSVTSSCKGKLGDGAGGSLRIETVVGGIALNKN